jgi:hypothetical protein
MNNERLDAALASIYPTERSGEAVQRPLPSLSALGKIAADAYNASTPQQTGWNEAADAVVAQMLLMGWQRRNDDLLNTLKAVLHYLKDREDVDDGNDGRQVPNQAMQILMDLGPRIDSAIWRAEL